MQQFPLENPVPAGLLMVLCTATFAAVAQSATAVAQPTVAFAFAFVAAPVPDDVHG